ncbi:MAG: hypothetical protein KatS3mg008_0834 [Acidimicrobiales bacterium]|nr:MAG: hypothetical protein KatS3mg008_0834 [Acidimicrobiales bacterium]
MVGVERRLRTGRCRRHPGLFRLALHNGETSGRRKGGGFSQVKPGVRRVLARALAVWSLGVLWPVAQLAAVHDRPGSTELVSVSTAGARGNSTSFAPSISLDGRYVVFESNASNLVAGDTNGRTDVFLRDVVSGVTTLVSRDSAGGPANGGSYDPAISDDGRFVVFESDASDLVSGDTNGARDVFIRDLASGVTRLVSRDSAGGPTNGSSFDPVVSDDGRFVAFRSDATDLVSGDTNGRFDIFVRDLSTNSTTLMSRDSGGGPTNGDSFEPAISDDGRFVAFRSDASDLVSGDGNGASDVFIRDRSSGVTRLVSVDASGGAANGASFAPSVSADGRVVVFWSNASDLVSGDGNFGPDVFARDVVSGVTRLLSRDTAGGPAEGGSYDPSVSDDGRFVAFRSDASDLVSNDGNVGFDVFIRDRVSGVTRLVSVDSGGGPANGFSFAPSISGDGRFVAFHSDASDLVAGDTNGARDSFVRHVECFSRFSDVPSSSVFCDPIAAMSAAGVVRGFSDGTFRPLLTANRQELAAMLYRWSGSPSFTPPSTPSFSDVPTSHVFYEEIEWAAAEEVVRGFPDGTFRPTQVVTRQEMAAMLYRLFGSPSFTPPSTPSFSDVPTSHVFYKEIEWAAAEGVASGFSDGTFRPTQSLRRQELAAFLTRARWVT